MLRALQERHQLLQRGRSGAVIDASGPLVTGAPVTTIGQLWRISWARVGGMLTP